MNTSISVSRTCAQHCRRIRAPRKAQLSLPIQQQPTRFISNSIPRSYAIPTEETPFSPSQSELHGQSPPVNQSGHLISSLPRDQHQHPPTHMFTGTVTRTSSMPQTVQITRQHQVFDKFLQKYYTRPLRLKAHDPNPAGFLREGDVVEYGAYTQPEKDTKLAKDVERISREEQRLEEQDKSGKAVRRFRRNEAKKKELKGQKIRGVQFVVRRVVTPFGTGLEERMEKLSTQSPGQEAAKDGGQDSLLKGMGGNESRQSGSAAVAG